MKTITQLHEIFEKHAFSKVDAHIHTHLCDGQKDLTVQNIAEKAIENGISLVILTPHFHKCVSDETATLYTDTNENIFIRLREEIEHYKGETEILLSTEADILGTDGTTALSISKTAEDALDLVTPTVNYHPALPLKAVEVTYGRCIQEIHASGLYNSFAEKAGGVNRVLEILYETEVNAIMNMPYPAMLGHFFAAHTYAVDRYNWFGIKEEHRDIMKTGAIKVIEACAKKGAMIDLTGIHTASDFAAKKQHDGFFFDFQKWFVTECRKKGIPVFSGSDAHSLHAIGNVNYYHYFNN